MLGRPGFPVLKPVRSANKTNDGTARSYLKSWVWLR